MLTGPYALSAFIVMATLMILAPAQVRGADLPIETAVLTPAPLVPPKITRTIPAKVIVNLDTVELKGQLADGVDYTFWTFGGTVPGSFIRVREGDEIEFHLNNHPSSKMPITSICTQSRVLVVVPRRRSQAPGHSSQFSFKALNPGLYVYHCATAPVGMHIANGMYGLILVEPKAGLPGVS